MSVEEQAVELAAWAEESGIGLSELARVSGLSREAIRVLAESGLIEARPAGHYSWRFTARGVSRARTAGRLRTDFGLNQSGLLLALTLIDRIEQLERRLRAMECQLPRRAP